MIGGCQFARARRHPLLELIVCLLQLLIENDIVEGDRQAAGENLNQRPIRRRKILFGLQENDDLTAASGAHVEHRLPILELVMTAMKGRLDQVAQVRIETAVSRRLDKSAVASRSGEDRKFAVAIAAVAQHQDSRAIDIQQRGNLRQHALGQPLHRFEIVEHRCRIDDDLQAAAGIFQALQLLIAAQRRGQRREQLVGRQFGLGLVIVDVVIDDDAPLRCVPGLPCPQDDANRLIFQILANVFDKVEPGVVGLHDHVEKNRRNIEVAGQKRAAFRRRIGRQDFQPLPVQSVVAERKARAFVNGGVVIDHGHFPALLRFAPGVC